MIRQNIYAKVFRYSARWPMAKMTVSALMTCSEFSLISIWGLLFSSKESEATSRTFHSGYFPALGDNAGEGAGGENLYPFVLALLYLIRRGTASFLSFPGRPF